MTDLPSYVEVYSRSPVFTSETVPHKLTQAHQTKGGVWGRLVVMSGGLEFVRVGPPEVRSFVDAGDVMIILPEDLHFVTLKPDTAFQIEFSRVTDSD